MQQAYAPKPTSTHFRRHFVKRASLLNSASCQASLRELSLVPRPHPQKERAFSLWVGSGHETTRELDSMPKPHPLNVHVMITWFRFVSFPGSIPGFFLLIMRRVTACTIVYDRSCATAYPVYYNAAALWPAHR